MPLGLRVVGFARRLGQGLLGRFVLVLGAVGLIPLVIIPWQVDLTRDSVTDQILITHSVTATVAAISVREKNKAAPPAIDEIILGLLAKDPAARRPASARELADALGAFADEQGWKWTAPALLAKRGADSEHDRETVAIPPPPGLG